MAGLATVGALLTVSSVSGLGHSSSSLSESVDLQIVEEIIERAPRSATSFPLVYRAYGEVLDGHGLTASNDTVYYQFLLKLGVIRAPTWGEKWDLYKATHIIASPRRSRHARQTSTDTRIRAKVPFLASASSDLDYGFQDGPDELESEGDRSGLRYPQPRTHLVGYPATPSMEYDALTLSTPYRTSTPNNAREQSYSHIATSPPLPPYSVSDLSESLLPDDSLSQRDRDESVETPKVRYLELEIDAERWTAEEAEEMLCRAEAFYRTGLLGRCWDVWHQAHRWVQDTTAQIDTVRSTILLRQTLQHWHAAYDRSLDMAATADQHQRLSEQAEILRTWMKRLKSRSLDRRERGFAKQKDTKEIEQTFRDWRIALNGRRSKRWEKDMAKREKAFTRTRDAQVKDETWQVWYDRMRTKVDGATADDFYDRRTTRKTLHLWLKRTVLERQVNQLLMKEEDSILESRFRVWHQRAILSSQEQIVRDKSEHAVIRRVWSQWRLQLWRFQQSRALDDRRIVATAFAQLVSSNAKLKIMRIRATKLDTKSLLRRTMSVWIQAERSRLFIRVREARLKEKTLAGWKGKLDQVDQKKRSALRFNDALARSNLQRSLTRWRAALRNRDEQAGLALEMADHLERKCLISAFAKWKDATARSRADILQADKARAFFRQRSALKAWSVAYVKKREERAAEMARLDTLRGAFDVWRKATLQAQSDKQRIAKFQRAQSKITLRKAFDHWTARVVAIKTREQSIVAARNVAIKRDALSRWRQAATRVENLKILLASSIEVHDEDLARDAIIHWKENAVRARALRQQAEQSMFARDHRLLQDTFATWRGGLKERRLEPVKQRVEEIVEDGLMFAVWDRWVSRSTKLPTIAFEKRRAMKMAFGRWKLALETRRKERSITIPQDHRLLGEIFDIWRDKTAVKLAASTKRRRGRLRVNQAEDAGMRTSSEAPLYQQRQSRSSLPLVGRIMEHPPHRPRITSATSSDLVRQLRGTLDRR